MNYVRTPPPRALTQKETLDTLDHWKSLFRNFFRRDSSYKQFLKGSCQWNSTLENYGLQALDDEEPADRAENLVDFLYTLAGFLPHSYLTKKIVKDSICLQDCWDIIYEHYNAQISSETFLDFEKLAKEPAENYRQFYEHLLQHVRLHLAQSGAKVENLVNVRADTLTISLMNLVAIQWLTKCHPNLVEIVRKEYSTELRRGDQLAALVPVIAPNIDALINRFANDEVTLVQTMEDKAIVQRMQTNKNVYNSNLRKQLEKNNGKRNLFCPGCYSVGKELKTAIDFKHKPSMCPRSKAVLRFLQAEDVSDVESNLDNLTIGDEEEHGKTNNYEFMCPTEPLFQNEQYVPENSDQHSLCQVTSATSPYLPFYQNHGTMNPNIKKDEINRDDISDFSRNLVCMIDKLEKRKHLWCKNGVRKEISPRVRAKVNNIYFDPVLDEGSEINCISETFAKSASISFSTTTCAASSANSLSMQVVGQTTENVVITVMHKDPILWDLKKCVVIKNLSVNMLIGEPGKRDNEIITIPHWKKIRCIDINGKTVYLTYSDWEGKIRHLCKLETEKMLFPGDSFEFRLPSELEGESEVALSPVVESQLDWLTPEIKQVVDGRIVFNNTTCSPVIIRKKSIFADVVAIKEVTEESNHIIRKIIMESL